MLGGGASGTRWQCATRALVQRCRNRKAAVTLIV